MARRTAQPPAEVPLYLNMPREEASRKIAERIKGGAELNRRPIRDPQTFQDAQRSCWTWGEYNEEMLRQMFTSPIIAEEYRRSFGVVALTRELYLEEEIEALHRSIDDKMRRLTSVNERLELIPLASGVSQARNRCRRHPQRLRAERFSSSTAMLSVSVRLSPAL